jgi:thioredoxin-like negative regulator of GroEL
MLERFIIAIGLAVAGQAAYRVLLALQRWRVTQRARSASLADRAALLIFTSPTCAPCKLQQIPIVERLLIDWHDRLDVQLIDVTEQPEVAGHHGVWSLPTTIVLKADRSVVAINQGVAPAQKLREQFLKAIECGV